MSFTAQSLSTSALFAPASGLQALEAGSSLRWPAIAAGRSAASFACVHWTSGEAWPGGLMTFQAFDVPS